MTKWQVTLKDGTVVETTMNIERGYAIESIAERLDDKLTIALGEYVFPPESVAFIKYLGEDS